MAASALTSTFMELRCRLVCSLMGAAPAPNSWSGELVQQIRVLQQQNQGAIQVVVPTVITQHAISNPPIQHRTQRWLSRLHTGQASNEVTMHPSIL